MATQIASVAPSNTVTNATLSQTDPRVEAARILSETQIGTGPNAAHRINFIEAKLDSIGDPATAAAVRAEVMRGLSTTEQAQLAAAAPGLTRDAGNGNTVTFVDNPGVTQEQWVNQARVGNYRDYRIFAQLAGANDNASILQAMDDVQNGRITPTQFAAAGAAVDAAGAPVDLVSLGLDLTQMSLDVIGIFDQTGISDGANALISAGRGDWIGAGLSVLAAVPVFGALATAGKLGKWAQTIAKAVEAAASNPAARQALEPALRRIHDALQSAPDAVMRALPDNIRATIDGIKTKLDDFFGVAGGLALRNADGSLNLANAAARYAEVVGSNRPWSWADDFGGAFTAGEKRQIREEAVERGLVPNVTLKPGTRYADFGAAGLISRVDTLPPHLWTAGDTAQFRWLDARIPGGRPDGMTWHHSEIAGRMELVPFGPHNTINHIGGRSPGHWAHAPR
jgi:A nuclease of the HNH/ENDO VII superfamily with conserved WHH